jgi:prefoldin subunit 5
MPESTNESPHPSFSASTDPLDEHSVQVLEKQVAELLQQKATLQQDIAAMQQQRDSVAQSSIQSFAQNQTGGVQQAIAQLVNESLRDLEQRKQSLQVAVEQLERRQDRLQAEIRSTFAGSSQDLAIRVQGFKDYLVGSLQDLAMSAEQLQLLKLEEERSRDSRPRSENRTESRTESRSENREPSPSGASKISSGFEDQRRNITKLLEQYRSAPDYYGPPWQLRRTFEAVHSDRVMHWLFNQGGRGAVKSLGSRLQNTLVAAAVVAVLRKMYGDRLRVLVLSNSPERLGDWRRGLQDCLGVSRADFGIESGIVLFDDPESVAQRAERLLREKQMPLIVLDESETMVSLSVLRFPLWLAFAPDPNNPPLYQTFG